MRHDQDAVPAPPPRATPPPPERKPSSEDEGAAPKVTGRPRRAAPRTRQKKDKVTAATTTKRTTVAKKASNGSAPEPAIEFETQEQALVSVAVYNERGRLVRRLLSSELIPPGKHRVTWDGRNNAKRKARPGTYNYQIAVESVSGNGTEMLEGATQLDR